MNKDKNRNKEDEHYVCYGGCKGVSLVPGTCQAGDCTNYGEPLKECDCGDDMHHNWKPAEK